MRSWTLGGYASKECPEKLRKEHHPDYAETERDPIPSGVLARMENGNIFEQSIGSEWEKALGSSFCRIPTCDRSDASKAKREAETARLMADPGKVRVIWNARFTPQPKGRRAGEPDALVWAGKVDGVHRWHPVDVKDHKVLQGTRKAAVQQVSTLAQPGWKHRTGTDLGAGSLKLSNSMQLAHYLRMLEEAGHAHPEKVGGIIGRELAIVWHDLTADADRGGLSVLEKYDSEFADRVKVVSEARAGRSDPAPEWKAECPSCQWRTTCHDELDIDLDHVTLLPGITPARAKSHYSAGVTRRGQLGRLDRRSASLVDGGVDLQQLTIWARFAEKETSVSLWPGITTGSRKLLEDAGVNNAGDVLKLDQRVLPYSGSGVWRLADSIDQARVQLAGKVYRGRGVDAVSVQRAAYEQDIDIEDADGYVYLIGVRTTGYKRAGEDVRRRTEYRAFVTWDRSPEAEAKNFAEFWDHVTGSQAYAKANRYGYVAYYYGHHEPSTFKKLAERHADMPGVPTVAEVERFFDLRNVVNLHQVLSKELIWPTPTIGLKDVAKWVRFSWRDEDPSGDNSMAWYRSAVESDDEQEREDMRVRLLQYNSDDTAAQAAVREWLISLGEARRPGMKLGNVADLDRRFGRRS